MFVFLCLFTLCSFIVFFIVFAFKAKEITTIKKKKTRENKFENKSKNVSHTGFIWIIKTRNKVSMLQRDDELGWCNYIMFYRRRSAFCTVWINSETFTHAVFDPRQPRQNVMDPRHRRQNFNLRHPRHPRQNFMDDTLPTPPTAKSEPRHPRTHAPTLPMPPTWFSRLLF